MENLTNEQIVDIINFYKECGISEDMYLSRDGVLDIFSLIGITPEFDEQGNRISTVYEDLEIPPVFREGKEVPIVFAIKHKVSKVHKPTSDSKIGSSNYTYTEQKDRVSDRLILNKLKQDYLSAVVNGNLNEATRIYDLIDKITGGKADFFIGVQYNHVKFYKKMQRQLLVDMFANFLILLIISKKFSVKEGIKKYNKLYRAFIQKQLSSGNFGLIKSKSIFAPDISNITISVSEDEKVKVSNIKAVEVKRPKTESQTNEEKPTYDFQTKQSFISYVKDKVETRIKKLKESFTKNLFSEPEAKSLDVEVKPQEMSIQKNESATKILESD